MPRIEAWLDDAAENWHMLSDRNYRAHSAAWRAAFDPILKVHPRLAVTPLAAMESHLPFTGFVFTIQAHPDLPTSPQGGSNAPVFGYRAEAIRSLDRDLLNACDAIICDIDVAFSCIYTHEAGAFWDPVYLVRGDG